MVPCKVLDGSEACESFVITCNHLITSKEFFGGIELRTPQFYFVARVQSLARELRSHELLTASKGIKPIKTKTPLLDGMKKKLKQL